MKSFNLFFCGKTKLNVLIVQILRFVLDDDLRLNSNDTLEINTTAPSVSCSPSCNYYASHESRNSSNGTYLVAVIKFTGDIVFNNGSIVKVFGDYALSMTSLNGSIDIQTDINMTCGETRLNTTCLGGFTQSAKGELVGPSAIQTLVYRGKSSILIFFVFLVYHKFL